MVFVVALRPGLVSNGWQTPVVSLVSWTLGKQDPHSTTKKKLSRVKFFQWEKSGQQLMNVPDRWESDWKRNMLQLINWMNRELWKRPPKNRSPCWRTCRFGVRMVGFRGESGEIRQKNRQWLHRMGRGRRSLGGGNSKIFHFHPKSWGRWTHFDSYFSNRLNPPTRSDVRLHLWGNLHKSLLDSKNTFLFLNH